MRWHKCFATICYLLSTGIYSVFSKFILSFKPNVKQISQSNICEQGNISPALFTFLL